MSMNRRKFLSTGLGAAATAGTLAAPGIVKAASDKTYKLKMTCAYPGGSPFYSTGPGSATDFIKRVEAMSGGRLKIKFYAAGELIPALGGFDAVRQGTVDMNWGNAYFWSGKSFAAQYFTAVPFGMDTLSGDQVEIEADMDAREVRLRIRDTGVGIPEEHLDHIFEPFFTTKDEETDPEQRGSGLGLSVSYSIIEAHAGSLAVESERGRGAVFTIRLPIEKE